MEPLPGAFSCHLFRPFHCEVQHSRAPIGPGAYTAAALRGLAEAVAALQGSQGTTASESRKASQPPFVAGGGSPMQCPLVTSLMVLAGPQDEPGGRSASIVG